MNYLAHAYLSFGHPQILVGNMISDFVKGSRQYDYPPLVQNGIRLHREIDRFTDIHPATSKGKQVFREQYGLYSGALMDVIYDHFLASDAEIFSEESLFEFSAGVYNSLEKQSSLLPEPFLMMLPYMKMQNWLYRYRQKEGIGQSLRGLVRRAAYLSDHMPAFELFQEHYTMLGRCYRLFMPDVKEFAKQRVEQLIS